ncbi:MAG: helix-turn-helix domain-containing protein [Pseudonocardia sp.]
MTRPHIPERDELAAALRGLRIDAELSTTVLAERLDWSQSRVSRIERGKTLPTPVDVDDWAQATHADPDVRRRLRELADHAQTQLTDWRRELAPGRRRKQQEMAEHEANASVIRVFGADVVPGLAQTRSYAAAMFRLGRPGVTDEPEKLDAVLDARMARQSIIDTGKRLDLLMSECALHRHLIPGTDQREQIDRLITLSERPNVRLGVIPFTAHERAHQYHGYAIYGDPAADASAVVLVETLTRGLTIRAADEITRYIEHFDQLAATALTGDDLRVFLREVTAQVTWP